MATYTLKTSKMASNSRFGLGWSQMTDLSKPFGHYARASYAVVLVLLTKAFKSVSRFIHGFRVSVPIGKWKKVDKDAGDSVWYKEDSNKISDWRKE